MSFRNWLSGEKASGFTLIELSVVILLAGLLITLTIPRFQTLAISDHLKSTTRKLVILIDNLRNEAVRNHRDYKLVFDLSENSYWIENSEMTELDRLTAHEDRSNFPEDIKILDILFIGGEKQTSGEVSILFYRKGYIQPSLIHIADDSKREFTISLSPFLGRAKVMEDYIESDVQL
jgi:prepilin-type N-terminal cleavage/methylation domain-containing protein